jgi:ABC-2 type transport system ATP-binding protein
VSDLVIETRGLRKEFRTRRGPVVAVDGLDLEVVRGGVHGLLGPNGSGKTSTVRVLLGLANPTAGEARLLGQPVPRGLPRVMHRVGALVDGPRFLPGLSARRNLTLLAGSIGVQRVHVEGVLDAVGLSGRGDERYRSYSRGLRQRLAIAATLLPSPEVLILDEPTSGLDPATVRDVRDLVRDVAGTGVTVLLCSHVLAEIQQVCDSVSIIANGRLLASGSVEELVGREEAAGGVRLRVARPEEAAGHLRAAGLRVTGSGSGLYVEGARDPATITRLLAGHGIFVRELVVDRPDLESVFSRLAGDDASREGER